MNSLFQQKQKELVVAVSKVEELSRQLEMLKNGKMDSFHDNQSSVAELDLLYKELQVCMIGVCRCGTIENSIVLELNPRSSVVRKCFTYAGYLAQV